MAEKALIKRPIIQREQYAIPKETLAKCEFDKHVVDVRDVNGDGVADTVFLEGCLLEIEEGKNSRIYHVQEGPQNSPKNFSVAFGETSPLVSPPSEAGKKTSPSTPFEKKVERFGTHFRRYADSHIRQLQKFSSARQFCSGNSNEILPVDLSEKERTRLGIFVPEKPCVTTDCVQSPVLIKFYKDRQFTNVDRLFDLANIDCLSPDLLAAENALLEKITSVIMEGAAKIFGPNDDPKEIGWAVYNVLDDHSRSRITERLEQIKGKKFCVGLECLYVRW